MGLCVQPCERNLRQRGRLRSEVGRRVTAGLAIAVVGTATAGAGGAGDAPEIRAAVSGASSFSTNSRPMPHTQYTAAVTEPAPAI